MDTLRSAVEYLAGACDHAQQKDNVGFNKFDSRFGHALAESQNWTPGQTRAAWQMLRKYSGQLASAGIDYNAIPEPTTAPVPAVTASRTVTLSQDEKSFLVAFTYDASLVAVIKDTFTTSERRFDGAAKRWIITARSGIVEKLYSFACKWSFEISRPAAEKMAELVGTAERFGEASRAAEVSPDFAVSGLGGTLRPFQAAGVAYALEAKRCFIADEMGLGKTIQALATVQAANAYPAIVVCPASLKLNWAREAGKWLPGHSIAVWNGKASLNVSADIVVINYDVLKKNLDALKALKPQAVVFDESHYAKNHKAARTEAAKELAQGVGIRLALTGTPVVNRPQELLSQLGIIGRLDDLGGFWGFAKRYCNAHQTRWGWDFSGAQNLDELNTKLRAACYIRRNKADVLKELPAKTRTILPIVLSNRREYDKAEKDLIGYVRKEAAENAEFVASIAHLPEVDQKISKQRRSNEAELKALQAEQLVRIEALKQLSANGKIEAIGEWLESFLETGEKLVLFAHHIDIVERLATQFDAPYITGATPLDKRQEYVDRFQNDPDCKLIVLNIRAGGVGLTLTAASNVAFVELDWTPAAHDQAEDRCHRIGQTDAVNAWYLLAERSIDQEIYDLIEEKRIVVTAATEGGETEDAGIMSELIGRLTKRTSK